jgi:hypothetical protein
MNNLVPEKRLDKNGVLTTKHVRAVLTATSSRTAIPAPTASAKPTITKARRPIYSDIMTATGVFKMTNKDWDVVREGLLPLSDEELSEVHGIVARFADEYPSVNWNFMKLAIRNGKTLAAARSAEYICGEAHMKGLPDTNKTLGEILTGLVEREQLVKDFSLPEDRAESIKATALVTQAILEYADNYNAAIQRTVVNTYHLKDHELAGFIRENADRSDDIVNAIRARGTVDVGMLRELLDHDVKSLTSGVL